MIGIGLVSEGLLTGLLVSSFLGVLLGVEIFLAVTFFSIFLAGAFTVLATGFVVFFTVLFVVAFGDFLEVFFAAIGRFAD